ncbi:hypothetical protein MEA186_27440 [Mesorhizobium amorphae CCNWGS0123]|uniref:Uncharacterized protein n=1 Tax=Mesorhizobium amorphae CCNWGS0123 TaxID=1082933 RepID=G6YHL8_9HYPH|nr:hypothetical protein MEA186_27440 [Mesorhizobium amorphae CCNWGS0123]
MPIFWEYARVDDGATYAALGRSGQAPSGMNVAWSFLVTTPIFEGR